MISHTRLRKPLHTLLKRMIHTRSVIIRDDMNEMRVYNRNTMSAKDMMREDGVYTTGRTIGGDRVVEFDLHARRIIDPYPECDMREEDIERIIGCAFRELNEFEEEKRFTLFRDENRALYVVVVSLFTHWCHKTIIKQVLSCRTFTSSTEFSNHNGYQR